MKLIKQLERLELLDCVREYGFCKGSEIYWLHRFKNLPENLHMGRRQLEVELVEILRIPKLSKSTFDKTYSKYNLLLPKLMSREVQSKIEMIEKVGERK